jgi:uncharacterized membrane protein
MYNYLQWIIHNRGLKFIPNLRSELLFNKQVNPYN